MRFALAVGLATLVGCGPAAYAPRGVLSENDVDERSLRAAGCLELALALRAPSDSADVGVLAVRFGNRCMRPAPFHLDRAAITGVDKAGKSHSLWFFDPKGELTALHVDSGISGIERLRIIGAEEPPQEVCIDVTRVLSAPGPVAPVCFRSNGSELWAVSS